MTEKEIEKVKEYISKKNELKNIRQRILELQQDSNVKEYISLVNEFELKNREKLEIVISDNGSNKILFEYGCYETSINGYFPCVRQIYRDLETGFYYYHIPFYRYFRTDSIRFENPKEKEKLIAKDCEYDKLRDCFFEQLLYKTQEETVEELLKNNKQLVKGK